MSQVEKKAGLLRRTSSSKKPLKEKVVLMYDEIFAVSIAMGECQWWKVKRNKIVCRCKQSPVCFFDLERRPSQKQPSLLGWAVSYEGKVKEENIWKNTTSCWAEVLCIHELYSLYCFSVQSVNNGSSKANRYMDNISNTVFKIKPHNNYIFVVEHTICREKEEVLMCTNQILF